MGLFKPAWMSNNTDKALNAVKKISDQEKLIEIAEWANNEDVRVAAVKKISSQDKLIYLVVGGYGLRCEAMLMAAVEKLTDQRLLVGIVKNGNFSYNVRMKAVNELTDHEALLYLAMREIGDDYCKDYKKLYQALQAVAKEKYEAMFGEPAKLTMAMTIAMIVGEQHPYEHIHTDQWRS